MSHRGFINNSQNIIDNSDLNLKFLFSQLNLNIMAVLELKAKYLKMIPKFSSESELLSRFLKICQKLVNKFYNARDINDFQNEYLMSSIRSKVKGDASLNISNCIINNWNDLKTNFLYAYSDKRDEYTLCVEMSNLKQFLYETPFEFYHRIQNILNLQNSYFKTHNSTEEYLVLSIYFNTYA